MALKPLADRLVIREEIVENKTESGIILGTVKKSTAPKEATVISVGPGRNIDGRFIPIKLNPGDRILYFSHAPVEIEEDGKDRIIIRETDVVAVL